MGPSWPLPIGTLSPGCRGLGGPWLGGQTPRHARTSTVVMTRARRWSRRQMAKAATSQASGPRTARSPSQRAQHWCEGFARSFWAAALSLFSDHGLPWTLFVFAWTQDGCTTDLGIVSNQCWYSSSRAFCQRNEKGHWAEK